MLSRFDRRRGGAINLLTFAIRHGIRGHCGVWPIKGFDVVKLIGPERIGWVHPDCGFWMLKRSVADRKIDSLVKGRDLYHG